MDDININCRRCGTPADPLKLQGINVEIEIADDVSITLLLCPACLKFLLEGHIADMDYDSRKAYIHYITNGAISPS